MKLGIAIFPAAGNRCVPGAPARADRDRKGGRQPRPPVERPRAVRRQRRLDPEEIANHGIGRDADIPVTLQGAEPDARALNELREVGVTRATLYAPSAGGDEVLRFLDDVAPLVDAVGAA